MKTEVSEKGRMNGKFDRSVSMLSWAYNEEGSIQEYLEKATSLMGDTVEDYEIVLIDDGSTDRTLEIAGAFAKKNPRLKIFKNEKNMNVGYSCRRAIREASKEFLFWQTVDWAYDISALRSHLEHLHQADVVAGARRPAISGVHPVAWVKNFFSVFTGEHFSTRSDNYRKAIVSLVNYSLIRLLFQVPVSDYQNVVFWRTKLIQSFVYEGKSSFVNPEGLILAFWSGARIVEVPIRFIPREVGEAKGTKLAAIIASVKDIFRLWFKWVVLGRRPFIKKGSVVRCYQEAYCRQ